VATFKEIVTKAVIGKGKKYFKNVYTIDTELEPTTVLGCWVINHKFKASETGSKIIVDGSYDVNIWYSYDNDSKTAVVTKKIDYEEVVSIKLKETTDLSNDRDVIVRVLKQPTCTDVEIDKGSIKFSIEKELGIEIVGETLVKISIEDEAEEWEEIVEEEEVTPEVEKEIDENVEENFI